MSIKSCLDSAEAQGEITGEERDAIDAIYNRLVKEYGSADAAKVEVVARLRADAEKRNRDALMSEAKRREIEDFVLTFRDARGQVDPAKAMIYLIEHHGQVAMPAGMDSVAARAKSITGLAMARLEGLLHEFRPTAVSGATRETARLANVVREAAGEDTGDAAAKGFAKAWGEVHEWLRGQFNAAGGAIGKLDGWFLPQEHDRLALIRGGLDTWKGFIRERLDLDRMRHPLTGARMTALDLDESLDYIWRNITSDGRGTEMANQAAPWEGVSAVRRGMGAVSNQRTDHRFLHFKNADAWMEYQAEFGGGSDPFKAMMSHVRGMAEDIAAMQVLGPNPAAMLVYLQDFVLKQAALKRSGQAAFFPDRTEIMGRSFEGEGLWSTNPESYARTMVKRSQDMWDIYRGAAGAAVNKEWADISQAVRNVNVGSKLGGAVLSSLPDAFTQVVTRHFNGLPIVTTLGDVVTSFTRADKREAHRASVISEAYLHTFNDGARWAGGMQGPEWTRYFAERVMAASGMNQWTDGTRRAFALANFGGFAASAEKSWGDMPAKLRRELQRYGLSEKDWDAIRLDPQTRAPRDQAFITPAQLFDEMSRAGRESERIAERYLGMVLQETEYATATGMLRARAMMIGSTRGGTWSGEILRHFWQFKSFSVLIGMLHMERMAREMLQFGWRGAGYAGAALTTMMIGGALALQTKEVAYGKEPRPMGGVDFWLAALLQSGGAGIWGDFLRSETNRMGQGTATTLAGPTAGLIHDIVNPVVTNAIALKEGKPTHAGRDVSNLIGRYTPGSSLWYARTAYSRLWVEQIQRALDPKAHDAFEHKKRTQRKDYGNEFTWAPGETRPRFMQ